MFDGLFQLDAHGTHGNILLVVKSQNFSSGDNADWDWDEVQDERGEWILMEEDAPGCLYNSGYDFCTPPQVHPFSAYHSPNGSVLWSELRLTFADSCPFRRFLRFDLEHGASNNHPESSSSGQCFGCLLP